MRYGTAATTRRQKSAVRSPLPEVRCQKSAARSPPPEVRRPQGRGLGVQFGEGELASVVNGDEQVLPAVFGANLGKVDVRIAHGAVRSGWRGQAADAVALKEAVQGRTRELQNSLLQGVESVVERQQGLLPEGHGRRFFQRAQHRRNRVFGLYRRVLCRGPLAPLGHRFWVQPVAAGQCEQAVRTGLDGLANGRRCAGAPIKYLFHKRARKSEPHVTSRLDGTIHLRIRLCGMAKKS